MCKRSRVGKTSLHEYIYTCSSRTNDPINVLEKISTPVNALLKAWLDLKSNQVEENFCKSVMNFEAIREYSDVRIHVNIPVTP
jgi:hypothetical protein